MMFKDACNRKSNQQNLGTISSSNLCTEIVEYTAPDEVAVCNLASIALPKFVEDGKFNHQRLFEITQIVTRNLNKIIDVNYYPVVEAQNSNFRHRPIGIGVQVCCCWLWVVVAVVVNPYIRHIGLGRCVLADAIPLGER